MIIAKHEKQYSYQRDENETVSTVYTNEHWEKIIHRRTRFFSP
ncbi:hypothetical protein Cabys_1034 [Caldithrix abyssi DSM 13497]|uniref:Uncharacterized protein n=1 Tax=Caldithrix abyssi DSM 13497 TaxID=880073 RepID=A0A1J1C561_CALAY|nr:hypothetical protein Cabys_1034 [Caldithrix abyssi DSM 13497]